MIRSITVSDTYPLRHQVLWPDKPLDFVKVSEDESGLHFGYFVEEQLVSVISLFVDAQRIARFRKFATHPDFQRKGLGSALLKTVVERAIELRATAIWCDARLEAKPFYERFGMVQVGERFFKGEIPYVKMMLIF